MEKVYVAVLQLQQQVNEVRTNVDTLTDNDKALSDHINKVSKAVQNTVQDTESPVGRANITVVGQQRLDPSDFGDLTWAQVIEESEEEHSEDQNPSTAAAAKVSSHCIRTNRGFPEKSIPDDD